MENITRQSFIQGSAAAAVAAGMAITLGNMHDAQVAHAAEAPSGNVAYSFETAPEPIDESLIVDTTECEILVVGAGVAAMPGIMYAAQNGMNVHVLEKGPTEGVHRLSIAGINSRCTVEAAGGVRVDPKQYTQDFLRYNAGFQSKAPVVSRFAKDSGTMVDWIEGRINERGWSLIPFPTTYVRNDSGFWTEYPGALWFMDDEGRSIPTTGDSPNWMKLFHSIAEDDGAVFHFDEPGVRIERGEDGRVTGVVSQSKIDGTYHRYNASLGVLLAAGDFFNDKEMVHKFCPHLEKCVSSICEPNNTGDMHKAAMWVGACMDDYSAGDLFAFENASCQNWIAPMPGEPGYNPPLDAVRGTMWAPAIAGYPVLWVDEGGRRFVNEDQYMFHQAGAQALLGTATGRAWSVWDSAWQEKFPADWAERNLGGLQAMMSVNTPEEVEREVELGLIKKFDTIDELIEGCGLDPVQFRETIERYNHLCEEGVDEDCFKDADWMMSIDTPPFYAAEWGIMVTSTRSGLKTDEHGRVIDTAGKIIPGLYAAGNNGGNFYGITYPASMGGTGIGHGQFYSWTSVRDMMGEDVVNTPYVPGDVQ